MSVQATLWDIPNAISSPVSEGGALPCVSPDGQTIGLSGPAPARASRSAARGKGLAKKTTATSGQSSADLSPSASLQNCLESRLRARLDGFGSPEYALTWKHWDMPSGPRICALRASARRTSASDCTGWPTARATGAQRTETRQGGDSLKQAAELSGWPTASSRDWKDTPGMATTGTNPDGSERKRLDQLPRVVTLADGMTPAGTPAETASSGGYRLNPHFSRWLMGFQPAWCDCAVTAMQSFPKSRRNSSGRP